MRLLGRGVALLGVMVGLLSAAGSADAAPAALQFAAPAACSTSGANGELPCTWTAGVNAYPGNSDGFRRRGTVARVGQLVGADRFSTVVIAVPVSAANYTDAHVEMPSAGQHEVYNCESANADYFSPSAREVTTIGRRVLSQDPGALVVIRPVLALGGGCDPSHYYPSGRYYGTGFTKGAANATAFAHFYTAILLRLAAEANALHHPGHVVLDDVTQLDCLLDDPDHAGYPGYFNSLPGQISSRYPALPQMASLDWNLRDNPGSACGWPRSHRGRPAVDELSRDAGFLSQLSLVGIQANFPLGGSDASVAGVVSRWAAPSTPVHGGHRIPAADLVSQIHTVTQADVVISAIGYNDCSENPAADPTAVPSWCNKIYGREQGVPSRAEVSAERAADTGALCYWTATEGTGAPWFLGLWWWNRDFDAAPYVNPYDLTWGAGNLGSSAMSAVRDFNRGADAGSCPASS